MVGQYGKSTKHSKSRHHQMNEDWNGLEAHIVQALEALYSLQFPKEFAAEKRREKAMNQGLC
jgi:hypothetical protein